MKPEIDADLRETISQLTSLEVAERRGLYDKIAGDSSALKSSIEEEKKGTPPLKSIQPSYHEAVMIALDTLRLHAPMEFNAPERDHIKCNGEINNPFIIHGINGFGEG